MNPWQTRELVDNFSGTYLMHEEEFHRHPNKWSNRFSMNHSLWKENNRYYIWMHRLIRFTTLVKSQTSSNMFFQFRIFSKWHMNMFIGFYIDGQTALNMMSTNISNDRFSLSHVTLSSLPINWWNSGIVDGPGFRIISILFGDDIQWSRWLEGSWMTLETTKQISSLYV